MMGALGIFSATPVLPLAAALPLGYALSWGLLLAAVCVFVCVRAMPNAHRMLGLGLAGVIVLSALLPITRGWTAYLALAFQTPSWVTLLACMAMAVRHLRLDAASQNAPVPTVLTNGLTNVAAWAGVCLGWALWVDTFNRWPEGWDVSLYAWGFGATALWAAVFGVIVWMGWTWRVTRRVSCEQQVVVWALLCFALTRWPSGNVWDALLDPWMWAACHWRLARRLFKA